MLSVNPKQLSYHDYSNYRIDIGSLPKQQATPSTLTQADLLRMRNERIFEEEKPLLLTAHSMEQDLYASASGSGISVVSDGMQLLTPFMDDMAGSDFLDSQFIGNFVLKDSFYRDQIAASYSGDELKAKMAEYDEISGRVIGKMAGKFAGSVGAFFNGTQRWLTEDADASANNGTQQAFDAGAFKAHILDIVDKGKKAMETLKAEHSDQWAEMLGTGGATASFFTGELEKVLDGTGGEASSAIERMGYGDIRALSQAIGAMGGGIYTNSSDMLAAYLGQTKAESEYIASHTSMSDAAKQAFMDAVDRNIGIKISSFRATWKRGLDSPDKELRFHEMYESFASLPIQSGDDFRAQYADGLKKLFDALTDRPGTPESPKANQINMAKGSLEMLANDWTRFLEGIGEADDAYAVSGALGNRVDVSI